VWLLQSCNPGLVDALAQRLAFHGKLEMIWTESVEITSVAADLIQGSRHEINRAETKNRREW
jgi:hypothetical protein